jgi:hypothetical protein
VVVERAETGAENRLKTLITGAGDERRTPST